MAHALTNFLKYFLFFVFYSGTWTVVVASEVLCVVFTQVLVVRMILEAGL